MRGDGVRIGLFFVIVGGTFWGGKSAQAAQPIEMPCRAEGDRSTENAHLLPCINAGDRDQLSNLELLELQEGRQRPQFKRLGVITQSLLMLRKEVITQQAALYRGIRYRPDRSAEESLRQGRPVVAGEPGATPYCSMSANPMLSISSEGMDSGSRRNHLDSGAGPRIPGLPAPPENAASCGEFAQIIGYSDDGVRIDNAAPRGTLEIAWYRGLAPQAIRCAFESVEAELLRSPPVLKVSDSCASMAADARGLAHDFISQSRDFSRNIRDHALLRQIQGDPCDESSSEFGRVLDENRAEAGAFRQTALRLCAHRTSFVNFFARTAYCEVNARASAILTDPTLPNAPPRAAIKQFATLTTDLTAAADSRCRDCYEQYNDVLGQVWGFLRGRSRTEREVLECANRCYQDLVSQALREEYRKIEPNAPACRSTQLEVPTPPDHQKLILAGLHSLPGGFLAFFSLLLGSRRSKSASSAVLSLLLSGLVTGCAPGGANHQSSCEIPDPNLIAAVARDPNHPSPSPTSSFTGSRCQCLWAPSDSTCCNERGGTRSTSFASRRSQGECGGSLASTLDPTRGANSAIAALDFSRAGRNLAEGGRYDSNNNQAATTDPGNTGPANQSAATADDGFKNEKTNHDQKPNQDLLSNLKLPDRLSANRAQTPRGSAGGGGVGGGGFGSAAPLHNPINPGNDDPSTNAAMAADTGAAMKAGGNGAAGRAGLGGGFGWSDSTSVAGGLFGGGTSTDFDGRNSNGAPVDPSGSADPDDYFTRIALDNDLFKIVRSRYHSTALRWRGEDSSRAADRAGFAVPQR